MESNTSSHTGSAEGPETWSTERRRLDRALAAAMGVVRDVLLKLAARDRLSMIGKCRTILDTIESQAIAEALEAGTPTRKVEDIVHCAGGGQTSKRTVKKKARRGAAVRENPELGHKMATGELSDEQVDVIATASEQTGGDAAHDTELIDKVAAAPPEQGKKLADKYVRDRQSQDDIDSACTRARRARRVSRYTNEERGTDVLQIEGAAEDIDAIEARVSDIADELYRNDGGRDVGSSDHRRTRDQRRFDAAALLIEGHDRSPGAAQDEPRRGTRKPTHKTTIVTQASIEQARGTTAAPLVLADGTPLPSAVAERLACGADMLGQVFGADDEILWQGRSVRSATFAQRLALIARDGGCVRCNANHSRCVAHHLDPWTSRLKGESNIDRMALLRDDCHHHIHDNELTLFSDSRGVWRARKARPEEIPAAGPPRKAPRTPPPHEKQRPVARPDQEPLFGQRE